MPVVLFNIILTPRIEQHRHFLVILQEPAIRLNNFYYLIIWVCMMKQFSGDIILKDNHMMEYFPSSFDGVSQCSKKNLPIVLTTIVNIVIINSCQMFMGRTDISNSTKMWTKNAYAFNKMMISNVLFFAMI